MKLWKHALLSLAGLMSIGLAQAQPTEIDRVAVIVNNSVILQSDIDAAVVNVVTNAKRNGQRLPEMPILREQIIDKLILDSLQRQEAERIGIRIDDEQLNQAIEQIATENQQSVTQLRTSIAEDGLSYPVFREQIRQEIAASEARNALVRRRINILPAEVDSLAQLIEQESHSTVEYKFSHIQLSFSDQKSNAELEKQAQELVEKLKAGADFSQMAFTYSKGPKAMQGGDWGWMRKEEMPTLFADQIKMNSKGSIIGPFRSGVGFHILKIDDVKGLETVAVIEVNARHILIKPTLILSDEGVKKQLLSLTQRIRSGEANFGEIAQQYSQDLGSAAEKGELGYQTPDVYVPEFKHQLETLPLHQISEPFKTVHGWHIVEVLDRREVDRTDSALKNRAYRILFNRRFNEEASAWLQELRAGAFVEILNEADDEH